MMKQRDDDEGEREELGGLQGRLLAAHGALASADFPEVRDVRVHWSDGGGQRLRILLSIATTRTRLAQR